MGNKFKWIFKERENHTSSSVQLHMLLWTTAGPKGEASPLSQKCIYNGSSSVKYYFLCSHKPSFSDNPKYGILNLLTVTLSTLGLNIILT